MSLSLPRSVSIASASRPDRIPTCSGGAAAMSSDAGCGQAPICASAGQFAGQQMQTTKIANRMGWSGTADMTCFGADLADQNATTSHRGDHPARPDVIWNLQLRRPENLPADGMIAVGEGTSARPQWQLARYATLRSPGCERGIMPPIGPKRSCAPRFAPMAPRKAGLSPISNRRLPWPERAPVAARRPGPVSRVAWPIDRPSRALGLVASGFVLVAGVQLFVLAGLSGPLANLRYSPAGPRA